MPFKKTTEDFVCEKCGIEVSGNGYTNHCTQCLWSKHVDVSPGDRAGECLGMMKPIRVEKKSGEYTIIHQCIKCGFEKPNKAVKEDNFDMLVQVSTENSKEFKA
ncbi:RNHCP domain-containing protein [Patescibacteria group bacterium]|nr:RNHCP domain-containing protein [Patescibacteria group bacterium]